MPFILGLFALVSTIVFFIWRARNAMDATNEIVSAADSAIGKARYWWFKRNYHKHPLQLIDDPREAATAWMVALAQEDGVISEAELTVIKAQMRHVLMIDNPIEILTRARWAVRDLRSLDAAAGWLMPLFKRKLGPGERAELGGMLEAVAGADGPASEAHAAAITRWRAELEQ